MENHPEKSFHFSNDWFATTAKNHWDQLMPILEPRKILEIGCYEGASTCYLIDKLKGDAAIEIHCIDVWDGGDDIQRGYRPREEMMKVERQFDSNIAYAKSLVGNPVQIVKHKEFSDAALSKLLAEGMRNYFDFVYVDGSHQAPDVLFDAVASFRLTRLGGYIGFDDYLWTEDLPIGKDLLRSPKPAIDAFTTLYWNKLKIIPAVLGQIYVQKTAE